MTFRSPPPERPSERDHVAELRAAIERLVPSPAERQFLPLLLRARAPIAPEVAEAIETFAREATARARGRVESGDVDVIAVIDREVCGPERRPSWKRKGTR